MVLWSRLRRYLEVRDFASHAQKSRVTKWDEWYRLAVCLATYTVLGLWRTFETKSGRGPRRYLHLCFNRRGRWGTTDDFTASFLLFSSFCFPLPSGTSRTPGLSIPRCFVFPPLLLSALSSFPFLCALQDGFCQAWWTGDMSLPLQSASLYNDQWTFMWSNRLLIFADFLIDNVVSAWDA